METTKSPPRTNGNGRQSHSPFYSRNNIRPSSIASSSVASILPSNGVYEKEKSEIHSKAPYGVYFSLQICNSAFVILLYKPVHKLCFRGLEAVKYPC